MVGGRIGGEAGEGRGGTVGGTSMVGGGTGVTINMVTLHNVCPLDSAVNRLTFDPNKSYAVTNMV